MEPGLRYVVDLLEPETDALNNERQGINRYPTKDTIELPMQDAGGPLQLYVLPIRYHGDGSGRLPWTGTDQLNEIEERLGALFPTPAVEIHLLDPMDWEKPLEAEGGGWHQLLNAMQAQRDIHDVPDQGYLYGMVNPREHFYEYCHNGCLQGLSNIVDWSTQAWLRNSVGLGFKAQESIDTLIHELGHAHGRMHAPCGGPVGTDPDYPYGDNMGSWGYESTRSIILEPYQYADFMSYCSKAWISDYNYIALFKRMRDINAPAAWDHGPDQHTRWQSVIVDATGRTQMGAVLFDTPHAPPIPVQVWTQHGIQTVQGHFAPYSHGGGGLLLVPEGTGTILGVEL
jgi:hypothetical protein